MTTLMVPSMRLLPDCLPKYQTRRRPERDSFGRELAAVARGLGQPFMPWQRDAADVGCELAATGMPAYRRVFKTVPRQQGKTTLFLSWQVHRCTAPRWAQPQRSAFTAQSGKDARDKWLDEIFPLLRGSKALKPLIRRINEGMGNESVRFTNGSLIRLLSTSTSSGHSKTLHQAVLDEIWHDQDARREQGLGPAMLTVEDAQILMCSTAGTDVSVIYDRAVELGRASVDADADAGFCFTEFSAPDGWDPDDEESYFSFMPALCPDPPCRCGAGKWRHTVTLDTIRGERDNMEPDEFRRAYGNIPDRSGAAALRADMGRWLIPAAEGGCLDRSSRVDDPVAIGFAVAPGGSSAAVTVAGRRSDGLPHGEVVEYRPGIDWALGRLLELAERWNPVVLVLNPATESGSFVKDLGEAGFVTLPPGKDVPAGKRRLQLLGAREYAQACGAFANAVKTGEWRHIGQEPVDKAVAGAKTRPLADAWAWSWSRSAADIGPLEADTLAWHGFMTHGVAGPEQFFGSWR